jgi:hypothetical protein
MEVATTPPGTLIWANGVFGNAIANVAFAAPTDALTIESCVMLEHNAIPWPLFDIASSALSFPFYYSQDEICDLCALLARNMRTPMGPRITWLQEHRRSRLNVLRLNPRHFGGLRDN